MSASNAQQLDVTLLIATHKGQATLREALDSVARQTLSADRFEVVIVENGPTDGTRAVIREWREVHPWVNVREAPVRVPGASHARNLGLKLARGKFVTFLDDDDALSPAYLEQLLLRARPGAIVATYIVDVPPDGPILAKVDLQTPDLDNYYSRVLAHHGGKVVGAETVAVSLSPNAGKLVPTRWARAVSYRENLRSGEDFVFWTELFARTEFCVSVLPVDSGAFYLRRLRPSSLSRREVSYDFNVMQRLACIAALSEAPNSTQIVNEVVRSKCAAQTGMIRTYLDSHPQDRARVMTDIAETRASLTDIPTLTRGAARDLAILYAFSPYADTSAAVASRRLRERGIVVDVVSNRLDTIRNRDSLASRVSQGYVDEHRELEGPQAFSSWKAMERFSWSALQTIEGWMARKGHYRSVYSRSMWPASTFATALFKSRYPEARWIAEFSDPQLHTVTGDERPEELAEGPLTAELRTALERSPYGVPGSRRLFEWAEWLPYILADQVVFTNENQLRYMMEYCATPELRAHVEAKSTVTRHPTLPPEFYSMAETDYALDEDHIHLGYFGVFYATRSLDEVLLALEGLEMPARDRFRLHIFTDRPDDTQQLMLERGLDDFVVVNSYRPFLEFLCLSTRLDVLIVNDARTLGHHSVNPYLPSKLADYLGSGSRIWRIVEPGSALDRIATEYRSELGDAVGALGVLRQIVDDPSREV